MNIKDSFQSRFVKSDDLAGQTMTLQVRDVVIEEIADGEHKPVMYFSEYKKGLVLNRTNSLICAVAWGDETDNWRGNWLDLFAEDKMFQGRLVKGLSVRCRQPNPKMEGRPPQQEDFPPTDNTEGAALDDIPF